MDNYHPLILDHVHQREEFNQLTNRTGWITPKRGTVVRRSRDAPPFLQRGRTYTPRGKWYTPLAEDVFGKRTVFRKEPVTLYDSCYYLELKGYGRDGREIYLEQHPDGDVAFGMYLDSALREFAMLQVARSLHLHVPVPLAVVHIPRKEYMQTGLKSLADRLGRLFEQASLTGSHASLESLDDLVHLEQVSRWKAQRILRNIRNAYQGNLEEGIEYLVTDLCGGDNTRAKQLPILSALRTKKDVGYLVRASRCPLRVGDPCDTSLDIPSYRANARSVGSTFRVLLEHGYLHHCPSTGNWTRAGELTDFGDVFNLATDQRAMGSQMQRVKKRTLRAYVHYLIGPTHTGVLCPYFIEGMFGERLTLAQAVTRILRYF